MKKSEWKEEARTRGVSIGQLVIRNRALECQLAELRREVEDKRKNWAPIPIAHPWTPRDPHCVLCDDPREAPRHNVREGIPVGPAVTLQNGDTWTGQVVVTLE